mgnify:CR=1 FL=1
MINGAAFTAGYHVPSARFRIRQHIPLLLQQGIHIREYIDPIGKDYIPPWGLARSGAAARALLLARIGLRLPAAALSQRADFSWLNREMIRGLVTFERAVPHPRFLDVDDAIWRSGDHVPRLVAQVDTVIAGNQFIADWFSQYCGSIHIVPTAIDTGRFVPRDAELEREAFVVGWTGTADNLGYLADIEIPLARLMSKYPDVRLMILSNRAPTFEHIPPDRVDFTAWTPQNEAATLQDFDAGLMPLHDTEWERGKCSFKMLQYMAAGIPAVVSPVGMNIDVAAHGGLAFTPREESEWFDALEMLYKDRSLARRMGQRGRAVAITHYDVAVVSSRLASIFKSALKGS